MENITLEEKIDYIYKKFKKEEKKQKIIFILRVIFYCSLILFIIFSYFYIDKKMTGIKNSIENIFSNGKENFSEKLQNTGKNFIDSASLKIKNLNNNY